MLELARPHWRTPSKEYPSRMPDNFWMLVQKRSKFHDPETMRICKAVAKSTGQKCRSMCVTGSDYCCKHGGVGHIKERIQRLGGPQVRERSVPSLSRQNIKKRLEVETYLHDMENLTYAQLEQIPKQLRREWAELPLGARARKYMEFLTNKKSF
jgi:hypothetical protein